MRGRDAVFKNEDPACHVRRKFEPEPVEEELADRFFVPEVPTPDRLAARGALVLALTLLPLMLEVIEVELEVGLLLLPPLLSLAGRMVLVVPVEPVPLFFIPLPPPVILLLVAAPV